MRWLAPDERVGLGHARLSIIDLSTGDQPISNEDGSLVIVHNGEFYDFERIRAELEGKGHRFRTKSDSEIALHRDGTSPAFAPCSRTRSGRGCVPTFRSAAI